MKALAAFLALAVLAATAPLWPQIRPAPADGPASGPASTGWPAAPIAADWTPLPLGPREARFARDFPGRVGVFATPDGRVVIVRQVFRPTRRLHPASDCLRALGYAIAPGPLQRDADTSEWSTLVATRVGERLRVRERLLGTDGRRWTDASAWYWSSAFGRAAGPWWAVTELAPASDACFAR